MESLMAVEDVMSVQLHLDHDTTSALPLWIRVLTCSLSPALQAQIHHAAQMIMGTVLRVELTAQQLQKAIFVIVQQEKLMSGHIRM